VHHKKYLKQEKTAVFRRLRPFLFSFPNLGKNKAGIAPRLSHLFPQVQAGNDRPVTFDILILEVIQKAPALTDHFEQAAAE
jgi:hypothetical protein